MRRNLLSRRGGTGGFSILEVVVALGLLAVLLLALFGMQATAGRSAIDTHDQIIAANAAHDMMEGLLRLPDKELCTYYNSYRISGSPNYAQRFDIDGYPAGCQQYPTDPSNARTAWLNGLTPTGPNSYPGSNVPPTSGYGFFVVREPTATEAPGYNKGLGPKRTTSWVSQPSPQFVPGPIAPPSAGNMSLLMIIVWVRIPHANFQSGTTTTAAGGTTSDTDTFVQLQAWRNFVS